MSTTKRNEGGTPDAVVVGGGLVGLCAALHLQRTGRQVTVVERGSPGDGASGHNAGIFSLANCVPTATPLRARRGVVFQVLDATSVAELEPLLAGRARHGVYIPDAPYALLRRPRPANRAARTAAWG